MSRKRDRLQNMVEANKGLLKESHEHSDEGKMEYIKGALKNLSSDDLDKIYLSVERFDPEYTSNIAKGDYRQSSEPGSESESKVNWMKKWNDKHAGRSEKDMFGGY